MLTELGTPLGTFIKFDRDYDTSEKGLFVGDTVGVTDTIHKRHPKLWELYKLMKSLDWDENEFDYSVCNGEFKNAPVYIKDMMIETLTWQWEADSAAQSIYNIGSSYVTSTELSALWLEISKNELLHSLTYSEIVKNSFDNPDEILKEVIANNEALLRLDTVYNVFNECNRNGAMIKLGMMDRESVGARKSILLFVITLLCLERIQFMASFAITFAIAENGMFLPIAKAVQKICNDEFQVHVQSDKEILLNELSLDINKKIFNNAKGEIHKIIEDIVHSELKWTEHLFRDGRELPGVNKEMIKDWVLYSAGDVYGFLGLDNPFNIVSNNPLKYMEGWMDINSNQPSPQEEMVGNYLLGRFCDDSNHVAFDLEF